MPKQPFISLPLDIADVRVLKSELTPAGELLLTIESTVEQTTCHRCGRTITEGHGTDKPRLLRHLPVLGRPVYLRIRPKRFRCPFCDDYPTTTQQLDWYDPQALHTKAFERYLLVQLVNSTISDVVAKEDVSYDALDGLLDRWIATTVDWARLPAFHTLGIDEFVEGLNTKLKVLKRRCYGLRNVGRLFQRLTLDLAGYRRFAPWTAGAH